MLCFSSVGILYKRTRYSTANISNTSGRFRKFANTDQISSGANRNSPADTRLIVTKNSVHATVTCREYRSISGVNPRWTASAKRVHKGWRPCASVAPNIVASIRLVPACWMKYAQLKLRSSAPQNCHNTRPMAAHSNNSAGFFDDCQVSHSRIASAGVSAVATPSQGIVEIAAGVVL